MPPLPADRNITNRDCSQQWPRADHGVHYICVCVALLTFCRNMTFAIEIGCTDGVDMPCLGHMQLSRLLEGAGDPIDWIGVSQHVGARLLEFVL